MFFANGLSQSSTSLVASANLIKKVYFPRLVLPISAVISGGVDFFAGGRVLLGMMQFRDVRYAAPFLIQARHACHESTLAVAWMFATPIAYSSSLLDEPWRTLYGINPMARGSEGFRWPLLVYVSL